MDDLILAATATGKTEANGGPTTLDSGGRGLRGGLFLESTAWQRSLFAQRLLPRTFHPRADQRKSTRRSPSQCPLPKIPACRSAMNGSFEKFYFGLSEWTSRTEPWLWFA